MSIVTKDYQGSLYAVRFSSGLIKVGRGIDPKARIASHTQRLSCAGIKVSESFYLACSGDCVKAEKILIRRCCEATGVKYLNEWFEGL